MNILITASDRIVQLWCCTWGFFGWNSGEVTCRCTFAGFYFVKLALERYIQMGLIHTSLSCFGCQADPKEVKRWFTTPGVKAEPSRDGAL